MSTSPKTVVILGASFAGLPLAQNLLKNTAPKVPGGLKVILVAPNTHLYWCLASVRGVVPGQDGGFADDKLFYPIAPGFSKYSAEQFEFVLGSATALLVTPVLRKRANLQPPNALHIDPQVAYVAKDMQARLLAGGDGKATTTPEFKPNEMVMFMASIGKSRGVGQAGSFKLPSFATWLVKSRTLMTQRAPGTVGA
ncbi:hypothetical protein MAPG_07316 [Magnaporthiopsis poae ATCC 64411]|uniref:FAD/NAD(P)-binding domain-containing protein n=1 Tax=Magnaporthiopsis poae (strain ATCC 64411 / 73-15) TaxID=644358 RepID=A0A0C4E4C3_MAGP6|nr:hypothetical protein MAPG_07316 [Magnaporthiopsis poae ATCC 64411]